MNIGSLMRRISSRLLQNNERDLSPYEKTEDSRKFFLIEPSLLRSGKSIVQGALNGDFVFSLLTVHVPLDLNSNVLDFGCGDGRVAGAFARRNFSGRYYAFDINRKRIDALQRLFKDDDRYSFTYMDVFHSYYNKEGSVKPEEYRLPYDNGQMDLVFLNSIFSHMKLEIIEHYLQEIIRCLSPKGKVWMTCYAIDERGARKRKTWNYLFNTPYEKGFTNNIDDPERLVGYETDMIEAVVGKTGLRIDKYIPGYWKAERKSLDQHEQDLFVLSKK